MHFSLKRALRSDLIRWDSSFFRKFLWVAIPIVIQNLVSSSLHIIDGVMIGQLGTVPHAAVTQANRYTFVFQLFLFGAGSGCGIYLSQYWGRKDIPAMRMVLGLCLRIALVLALLFAGAALLFTDTIVLCFLPRGESFGYAAAYLKIVAPGYFLQAIDLAYASCMKSSQQTRIPMTAGVISILVNTFLNYCLIYGKLGFPAMGVEGAALATVISAGVALLIDVGCSYGMKLPSGARLSQMRLPDWAFIRKFLKTVGPVVLNEGFWSMGITMYSVFYGRLGNAAVSATGIYNNIDQLIQVLVYGIMNATAILVGSALGAGKREEAYLTAKRMLFASAATGVAMGMILLGVRGPLVGFFKVSEEAQAAAKQILLFSSLFLWVRAMNSINVVGVLRAGGDTIYSMVVDVGAVWLVGVPLVGIAAWALHWPVEYVFCMTAIEEIVKLVIALPRFKSRKWMNDLTRHTGQAA